MKRTLSLILILLCTWLVGQAEVIISQVFYDSPLNEEINRPPYSNGEFIELHNTSVSPASLTNWTLHGGGKTEVYEFPAGTTISSNGYLIVAYRNNSSPNFLLDSLINIPSSCPVLYQRKIVLSNGGESLTLYNGSGACVDTMRYTAKQAVNTDSVPLAQCRSMQRVAYSCDQTGTILFRQQDWKADTVLLCHVMPWQEWLPTSNYYSSEDALPVNNAFRVSVVPRSSVNNVSISDGQVSISGGGLAQVTVEWANPLGKSAMLMSRKQTPSGKHLVSMTDHTSDYGTRQWMPIPVESDDLLSPEDFAGLSSAYYQDDSVFTKIRTEQAFHGRTISSTQPGEDYQSHPAQDSYGINGGGQVKRWHVGANGATRDGFYQGGFLQRVTHADEDGKTTTKYTNPQGQLVLLKVANNHETNYIYDDLGRLRYVLPPSCSNSVTTDFTDNTEKIKQYAYIYRYDNRGNCIYKKLPGCEPLYMVFDQAGRQVLSQDGNQRLRGDMWTIAQYTEQGQLAYTAEVELVENSHDDLIGYWSTRSATAEFTTNQGNPSFGYAADVQINRLLVVNYYDSYDFLELLPDSVRTNLTYNQKQNFGEKYNNSTGLLTGKRVYSFADSTYTTTAYYYDMDNHIIQRRSTLWHGGYDIMWAAYNFDGAISKMTEQQGNIIENYWYEYDLAGRLQRTHYQLNNDPVILLSNNSYTELGQLDTHGRHDEVDMESYSYDVRGNTTQISSGDFTEQITYANGNTSHNGTISEISVSQGGVNLQWTYQYDNQNRLSSAQVPNGNSISYSETFSYDPMGNILTLNRTNNSELIDELTYTYNGNQLTAISDNAGEQSLYDQKEYVDRSNAAVEMCYDANGNLTKDLDRNIDTIHYNILNLPSVIRFSNGDSTVNVYNAEGVKLFSTYYTLPEVVTFPLGEVLEPETQPQSQQIMTVRYFGHMDETITTDTLYYTLHTTEGYIALDDQEQITSWNYFRRDHLGNNVAVWNATADSTIQRMFYYPSGLPLNLSTNQGAQPYKYNGKEYDEMHGYDVYDYGFRGYYATIARFTSSDPLCEQTPWQSPYTYASNNFTGEIDWMGLFGSIGFVSENYGTPQCVIIDNEGFIKGLIDDGDMKIYLDEKGTWKPEDGKEDLVHVGWMMGSYELYKIMYEFVKNNYGQVEAFGLYEGQWTISISLTVGPHVGYQLDLPMIPEWLKFLLEIDAELVSFEIVSISKTLSENEQFYFNYVGKNDLVKATTSITFGPLSVTLERQLRTPSLNYYPASTKIYFGGILSVLNRAIGEQGKVSGNISFAFGIGASISINGNVYYKNNKNN